VNEELAWYLARSAGMAAAVLMVAALVLGVLAATRALKDIDRPAWLVALHRWLSVLTVVAVVTHLVALVADSYVHFGLVELLVPGTSSWRPLAVSLGVIALYLFAVVHVSSVAMKRLPKVWWRRLHTLSYVSVWAAMMHAGTAGTDTTNVVYRAVAMLLTMGAVTAALLRVILGRYAARAAAARRSSTGEAEGGERRRPRPTGRVDEVEVVVAGDVDDRHVARRNRVRGRDDVVGTPANDRDADTIGDGGSRDGVAIGQLGEPATEEFTDSAAADTVAIGSRQVGDRRQPDGDARRHDRVAARSAARQQLPTGEPQGEVTTGGVADDGNVVGVEAMVGADRDE
jgi:DMSO/TMAO reductase YedYZ heme-binding membrane subunit